MFIRLLFIGLIVTLVTFLPAYMLFSDTTATGSTTLMGMIATFTFLVAAVSAWLGQRFVRPTTSTYVNANQDSRELGTVKWFNANKGFGFITRDSGEDVFVHFRSIRGKGHRVLRDGQRVDFLISQGNKGLQAEDVAVAS
jgi:CspA family cold shock protein